MDNFGLDNGHTSHVLLYYGYDLAAAGIWEHDIAPCFFCKSMNPERRQDLILTDETLRHGLNIHFVCCSGCGTRGPWADKESQALAQWNAAYEWRTYGTQRSRT